MSQGGSFGTGGGGGTPVQTINGDSGSISGSSVTIYANNATSQAGSSVKFVNSGTVSTLQVSDVLGNTLIGSGAGNLTLSGTDNIGIGTSALQGLTSGLTNVAVGFGALAGVTTGQGNIGIGQLAGAQIKTGGFNVIAGLQSGQNYTTSESANICIQNDGVAAESHVIRLGTQGAGAAQQNRCFIAGIGGVTTAEPAVVTVNSTTGEMSTVVAGTSGNVLTSNGTNWVSAPASGGSATSVSTGMTTNQSIAQNALVDVVYDTVIVDTASGFSAGAYTIPTTGNWQFSISAVFKSTAGFTNCDVFLRNNGATFLLHGQPCVSISDPLAVTVNAGGLFALTSGDVITISVFAQTSGGTNYDCLGFGNGYYNTFAGVLIA